MATVMPEGEAIRRAVKWVAAKLDEDPHQSMRPLLDKAGMTFNLSPREMEFLDRFYRDKTGDGFSL